MLVDTWEFSTLSLVTSKVSHSILLSTVCHSRPIFCARFQLQMTIKRVSKGTGYWITAKSNVFTRWTVICNNSTIYEPADNEGMQYAAAEPSADPN